MPQKKDQFVIACLFEKQSAERVVQYAQMCASMLNKGLVLLHVCRNKEEQAVATEWVAKLGQHYMVLHGKWKTAIGSLPNAIGGVLTVAAYDRKALFGSMLKPGKVLRMFNDCRTAYMLVPIEAKETVSVSNTPCFRKAICTLDFRREGKDKLIWASYFPRFLGSDLTMACPKYKDERLEEKCHNNRRFAERMLKSLNVKYSFTILNGGTRVRKTTDRQALDELKPDVMIVLATNLRERDTIDLIIGREELRLLKHAGNTPVLMINQREDVYVLCD
ncbi:MAG: hypothetical protein IJ761_00605 [Bacteroidales bacterium]|nr:hypothetical protein [Bacteroidales bacterium]